MEFVFWENIVSPHKAPFLRALADLGHDVTMVAEESMTSDRLALGWKIPDMGKVHVVIGPDAIEVKRLIEQFPKETIHILAGARICQLGPQATKECLRSGCRMGILTEAPDPRGLLGYGRWIKYAMERYTKGLHYEFVLAMGELGVSWFRRCGYSARNVFPFAYVTSSHCLPQSHKSGNPISLLYAGQFIDRKGLDILIKAFAATPHNLAQLQLLGEGPAQRKLQDSAQRMGIQSRIIWLPKRDSSAVEMAMATADVTILPSRHDGWGAVVNESLMVGSPVICSTACGAADFLREPYLGSVFRSGNVADLARALKHWVELGPRSHNDRQRIRQWAACISGQAIAKYFIDIMKHVYCRHKRPVAPWRMNSQKSLSSID